LSSSRRCSPPSARWLRVLLPTTNGPARSAGNQRHVHHRYQCRLHRHRHERPAPIRSGVVLWPPLGRAGFPVAGKLSRSRVGDDAMSVMPSSHRRAHKKSTATDVAVGKRRGNPNLSGTVCRTALACLTVGHMSVFPAARNGRPPALQPSSPSSPRLGVAHVP